MASNKEIAQVLRDCAYALRNNGQEHDGFHSRSHYICDTLKVMEYDEGYCPQACRLADGFLRAMGMGTGFGVFGQPDYRPGKPDFSLEQQFERMAWLFFAADLAEELGVDWALQSSEFGGAEHV